MAQPIACQNEDGALAAILLTDLETGETDSLCKSCYTNLILTIVGAILEAEETVTAGAEAPGGSPGGDDDGSGPAPVGEELGRGRASDGAAAEKSDAASEGEPAATDQR